MVYNHILAFFPPIHEKYMFHKGDEKNGKSEGKEDLIGYVWSVHVKTTSHPYGG